MEWPDVRRSALTWGFILYGSLMTHIGVLWSVLHCRKEAQTVARNLLSSGKVCASFLLFVRHIGMHWWRYKPMLDSYGLYIDIICSDAQRVANRVYAALTRAVLTYIWHTWCIVDCPDTHWADVTLTGRAWHASSRELFWCSLCSPLVYWTVLIFGSPDVAVVALLYFGLFWNTFGYPRVHWISLEYGGLSWPSLGCHGMC